jgi:hypothetical protein
MLGIHVLDLWLTAPNYMTWYIKISHLYNEELLVGNLPRLARLDGIVHEAVEVEGDRIK